MDLRALSSLSLTVAALTTGACGGVAYVGDLPGDASVDSGTPGPSPDSPDSSVPPRSTDGGADGSTPNPNQIECLAWQGSCRGTTTCGSTEVGYPGRGCTSGEVCCAPRCYPPNPGCPPGMMPSITADAQCGANVHCIPAPTACSSKGGTCELDDGTGLTDPCTATGRPIGPYSCQNAYHVCCMPK